jgi:hypothetical protein
LGVAVAGVAGLGVEVEGGEAEGVVEVAPLVVVDR